MLNEFEEEFVKDTGIKQQEKELQEDGRVSGVPRKVFSSDHEKIRSLQRKHFDNELKVYDILQDLLDKMDNQKIIKVLENRFEKETIKKEKAPELKNIRVTSDFIQFTKNFTTVDRGNRFHGNKKLDFKVVFSIILDEYLKKHTQF
ncbi:hypothetical protein NM897_17290 (plasmid) [Planococcus maritimus]|uniref:hypothetical protein n=1 Tax=Planococcus maritimus TaxID=192421 RepID=UPI0031395ED7